MTTGNQNDITNTEPSEVEVIEVIETKDIVNTEENPKPKREIIKGEKILLIIACVTAVLFDRLFFNIAISQTDNIFYFAAIFEICFIIMFCLFNRDKLYKKPLLLIIAGMIVLLCVWNFIFDYASSYGDLTFVVIPATLMMFTQLTAENHDLKNTGGMIKSWFSGWFVKPFSAISKCAEVLSALLFPKTGKNIDVIKKVIVALLITVPLAALLIMLLSGADKVFGYYVSKIFTSFDISDFILHGVIIAVGFLVFYSFFWNNKYNKTAKSDDAVIKSKKVYEADNLTVYIILGAVLILYILFCMIQFAYLFASAGLPAGISYAEYAREGFAQIVMISGINLIIFGSVLKYGKINKQAVHSDKTEKDIILKVMLYVLIAVTGIMLVSGFMRLKLYIDTFGMTFLRLLSAWFIIYLSLVLILCAARIIKPKIPLISSCAVLLLLSYNILGYINPDAFIVKYNLSENAVYHNVDEYDEYAFYNLSDDALNVLLERGLDKEKFAESINNRYDESAGRLSISSIRALSMMTEYLE